MKTYFCFISRHFNGSEYFSRYFHGAQEESSLDHEFHKCMFHGHENKDNQFFMALSRLFNTNWFHSVRKWVIVQGSMAVNINFRSFATVLIFSLPWGEILLKPIIFTQKTSYLFPSFHTTCQLNNFFFKTHFRHKR